MKIREHRGGLSESMDTVLEIDPTIDAIVGVVNDALKPFNFEVTADIIKIEKYGNGNGIDECIGWDTHIVTIKGYGVFGFTDSPIKL